MNFFVMIRILRSNDSGSKSQRQVTAFTSAAHHDRGRVDSRRHGSLVDDAAV